ncbi:MAG TPA: TerB family tellurite resistance protein [Chryseolinea sp.]
MSALAQLKLLISLAQIDGQVAERERNFITSIGKSQDITMEQMETLFDQRHALIVPDDLTDDQRFEYLFSLVKLMKIDERMYKEEMLFCTKIAENLGYENQVMFELLLHVKAGIMEKDEIINLKEVTQKHLKR